MKIKEKEISFFYELLSFVVYGLLPFAICIFLTKNKLQF